MKNVSSRGKATRILIVDDHPLVRRGLAEVISHEPDWEVCGEAATASEALRLVSELAPDLVTIDISLNDGNGMDLIKQVNSSYPEVKVLVASMHDESLFAERCLRAGAMGYINKIEATEKVLEAIRTILDGKVYLSEQFRQRMVHRMIGREKIDQSPLESLSNRKLEVFSLIGHGLTTREIADKLHLSPKTIYTHRKSLKLKLNLKNATELNHHAVQWVLEQA